MRYRRNQIKGFFIYMIMIIYEKQVNTTLF